MSTITHAEAIERFGIEVETEFAAEDPIPVLEPGQFQGDIAIVPEPILDYSVKPATGTVPREGVPVVRGENGGNTHLLLPSNGVTFDLRDTAAQPLLLGVLTVTEGSTAYLAHPEHGYSGVGPGTYEIRRQREQGDEIRMVQD